MAKKKRNCCNATSWWTRNTSPSSYKDMAKPAVPFGGKYRIIDFHFLTVLIQEFPL